MGDFTENLSVFALLVWSIVFVIRFIVLYQIKKARTASWQLFQEFKSIRYVMIAFLLNEYGATLGVGHQNKGMLLGALSQAEGLPEVSDIIMLEAEEHLGDRVVLFLKDLETLPKEEKEEIVRVRVALGEITNDLRSISTDYITHAHAWEREMRKPLSRAVGYFL